MGYVEYVTIIEELSRVDGRSDYSCCAHIACSNHIFLAGHETQKRIHQQTGHWRIHWRMGIDRTSSGSDAGSARMTAVRKGGNWVLNGTKTFAPTVTTPT